ncbi:MAG: thiosulfate oxidation carrier protein SoxY [Acetobacteraceae bacterium]|nr:thiosulfate oxidation carrier protein SoxY [Acetobacteraceae bacterium]
MNGRAFPAPRRAVLALGLTALPAAVLAQDSPAVAAAIRELAGDGPFEERGITLRLPPLAENGGQVPLTVQVDSPQTADRHVTAIHVFATRNPTPDVASFRLTPHVARAEVQTRIRLAEDQRVLVVAVLSDGTRRRAAADVRVGQGGCLS